MGRDGISYVFPWGWIENSKGGGLGLAVLYGLGDQGGPPCQKDLKIKSLAFSLGLRRTPQVELVSSCALRSFRPHQQSGRFRVLLKRADQLPRKDKFPRRAGVCVDHGPSVRAQTDCTRFAHYMLSEEIVRSGQVVSFGMESRTLRRSLLGLRSCVESAANRA